MAENILYDEKVLLHKTAKGDEQSFSQIIRHYSPVIYRHLLTYIKNAHDARELTQDVFMSLWRNREKLADMDNFGGYVYIITRNMALRALRNIALQWKELPEDMIQTLLQSPALNVELKELKLLLDQGIEQLPDRRRRVFQLSRMEQLSYEEIATILNISRSAVKQHIIAALVFLRTYIREKADVVVFILFWLAFYR